MLTPFVLTMLALFLCIFLLLLGLYGIFMVAMGLRERYRCEKALRRAGI